MKLAKNTEAISRLALVLLLLISFVIGAFLSYLWAIGPIIELGIRVPVEPSITATNVSFTPQNTSFFNVTLLNPSYSPSSANVWGFLISTGEGKTHSISTVDPSLPYELLDGTDQTFQCFWNWADYTGQRIGISAHVENASGATLELLTPFVGLQVTEVDFDASTSIAGFNLTVRSHENSTTYANITDITVQATTLEVENVYPLLPYTLSSNSSVMFKCLWDWTDYRNANITIIVNTLQGYFTNITYLTPNPILEVKDILFSETDTNYFNITIQNSELSPSYLDISGITLTLENATAVEIDRMEMDPSLPYQLGPSSSMSFQCPWNWTTYRNKNVTLSVHTSQDYTIYYTTVTPSPIEITSVIFDPINTNSFNLTVQNSRFYTRHVNLTDITLVFENGTVEGINGTETTPQLPYNLEPDSIVTFLCPWNWVNDQGKNITVMIRSRENYTAQSTKVTPTLVLFAITSVTFDPIDTEDFDITVINSEFSLEDANIAKITVTLKNGTEIEISNVLPVLPYRLNSNSTALFQCKWDWTSYRGRNVVITVYTTRGYTTSTQYTAPPEFPPYQSD